MNKTKKTKEFEDIIFQGKLQPQALDLEEAVLGAVMLEKHAPDLVINLLVEDSFYSDSNKLVWKAIQQLYRDKAPIDIRTVVAQLRTTGDLELAGGAFYVSQLSNSVSSSANIEYHAHILVQKYIARQLINISGIIGKDAFEDTTDPFELQQRAMSMIEKLLPNSTKIETFGDIARKTYQLMRESEISENFMIGLPSKHKVINDFILGYAPGVYVVAGRPGEGKTGYVLEECFTFAQNGTPSAYLCAEMGKLQLCRRIFSNKIEESSKQIRLAKNIDDAKWDDLHDFVQSADKIPLYLIDVCGYNIDQIVGLIKELVRKHGIKAVAIDYLHLIKGSPLMKYGTEELRLSDMTSRIKVVQREHDLVVFELSQLTRLEKGVKRIYQLSDLKGSGGIEADADVVMFIYHPWMHGVEKLPGSDRIYKKGEVKIIFAKFREDETGMLDLIFEGKFNKFKDYEDNSIESAYRELNQKPIDFTQSAKEKEDELSTLPF